MDNCYTVYIHINKINNKVYIGQSKNIKKRWSVSSYKNSTPRFYKAIEKYGWDNFKHIILKENLNLEEANYWEKYYIQLYHSTDIKYGYNLSEGGSGTISLKGENNPFYNHKHTEANIQLMKKKKYGGNNPNAKRVLCITTGDIFPSCREAADWCGIPRQNINRCCVGGRPSAGKHPETKERLIWRYVED